MAPPGSLRAATTFPSVLRYGGSARTTFPSVPRANTGLTSLTELHFPSALARHSFHFLPPSRYFPVCPAASGGVVMETGPALAAQAQQDPGRGERAGDPQPLLEAPECSYDPGTSQPLTRVDPVSGLLGSLRPGGAPLAPRSDWAPPDGAPPSPRLSLPSTPPLRLRLCNTLTGQEWLLQTRGTEVGVLLREALPWNAHIRGYTWRWGGGTPLDPQLPPPHPEPPLDPEGAPETVLLYFADDFVEV
ncbi:cytochrome b5 domain-containing protein 1 [Cuculus canorus]|uniref:cytochrome b5 domain-containing protein 1 n=1 Tax=Cuculus canorus TaxID=55661 RepID=UPI0023AB447F|nr:cytochrome b5 domain-containing protein 1 [Cuculus canorus]XP_053908733.1 cytochrome b5 domain-containing protein 1 [Cuculus canorus]